jgi:non-canonical (house-cleaning) NTP pyrophosphatase
MARTLREFLGGYQRGIEVCVAGDTADLLLGVREAFRRYFHDGLDRPLPVAVVPHDGETPHRGLARGDEAAVRLARASARALEARLPGTYHFYVATEFCVQPVEIAGRSRWFVRGWSAVVGPPGEAWGSGGGVQLPDRLVEGLSGDQLALAVPGTRRAGGTIASLTGGLETRRSAVAQGTLNALASLFYGILESRPGLPR